MLLAAYVTLPMLLGTWIGERCFYKINLAFVYKDLRRFFIVIGACTAYTAA